MKKSVLAFALALCLMLSAMPVEVLAENSVVHADIVDPPVAPKVSFESSSMWLDLDEESADGLENDDVDLSDLYADDTTEIGNASIRIGDPMLDDGLIYGTEEDGQASDSQGKAKASGVGESEDESADDANEEDALAQKNAGDDAKDPDEASATNSDEASEDENDALTPTEDEDVQKDAENSDIDENGDEEASEEASEGAEDVESPEVSDEATGDVIAEEEKEDSPSGESEDAASAVEAAEDEPSGEVIVEDQSPEAAVDQAKPTGEAVEAKADPMKMMEERADEASDSEDKAEDVEEAESDESAKAIATEAASTEITVAPGGVGLPYKTLRMAKGERVQLRPTLGEGVTGVTYTSSKKKIARVSADGVIRGLKQGTAYVTLKTNANVKFRLKVVVKRAPSRITASPNPLYLGVGETYTLGYKTPAGTAAGGVTFAGDAPEVFSVDENTGAITALATGSGTVTLTTFNGKTATCPVTVYEAPTEISFDEAQTSVGKKQKLQLQMKFNEGSWSNITYVVDNPKVAKVSATGLVTGVSVGQTVIHASTFVPGVSAETVFTVWGAPSKVWVDSKKISGNVGVPFQLEPRIPVGSRTTFKYKSSKKKVATVSADGVVTPLKKGKTKITITTHNKKKVTLTLTVYDPGQPNSVKLKSDDIPVLYPGDVWQAEYEVKPEGAIPQLVWTSSNTAVATVDQEGYVSAVGYGVTTITAVSAKNQKLSFKFKLSVQTKELSLIIPDRTTDVGGISENLALIDAIKDSTIYEINRLKAAGDLSGDSASRRKEIVENIFENYAFPWMTPSKQKYWKAANSENGAKDFKVGKVYYGMPYISGSGANRRYTAALAISEGRYTDSGQGYYVLNQGAYLNGKYVGNDCSGLVNVSIWGVGSSHAADRTADIAVSADYTTIGSYTDLLPGDLICKGNSHVVMFLYYASSDKSKIMIIENGGSEKGTNTVHCDIKTASAYQKSGYKIRRAAGL